MAVVSSPGGGGGGNVLAIVSSPGGSGGGNEDRRNLSLPGRGGREFMCFGGLSPRSGGKEGVRLGFLGGGFGEELRDGLLPRRGEKVGRQTISSPGGGGSGVTDILLLSGAGHKGCIWIGLLSGSGGCGAISIPSATPEGIAGSGWECTESLPDDASDEVEGLPCPGSLIGDGGVELLNTEPLLGRGRSEDLRTRVTGPGPGGNESINEFVAPCDSGTAWPLHGAGGEGL